MLPLNPLISLALIWALTICNLKLISAWDQLAINQKFTLEQTAVERKRPWSHDLRRPYLKYGVKPPAYIEEAVANYEAMDSDQNQTTVGAKPFEDMEYLIDVTVGNHNLTLDPDTGSADLWVFSTLQPSNQRRGRQSSRIYDPNHSGGKQLQGHTWQIRYGDGSGANGQVYIDKVGIGSITFPNQAIGAASKVSTSFSLDPNNDGLLGLAFSRINAIRPKAQLTWFDNVKPRLAAPVFTCALKRRQIGSYDFGFIDRTKYKGDLTWVNVKQKGGFWDFSTTGFAVGDGQVQDVNWESIADTGTSLWYVPPNVASAYWAGVEGAAWKGVRGGWTFPCNSKLPDITLIIAGKRVTVPGINMNYQSISQTVCYGGIQRTDASTGMQAHIAGDVFLKNMFVAFEHPVNGQARLGFAQQS